TTDSNVTADNNEQQTTDSNVTADNNEQQTTDSNVTADNNEQQATEKSLPETGETQTNSSLVTIFASVLLAVGSLLTFKRFSNNK
ncbi:LPXTG cell wall anchor domain-containing protein, partial [Staphylococcus hominis]